MSEREYDVLNEMGDGGEWLRPMDVGAWDGSHHSGTLRRLCKEGLVERKKRDAREWPLRPAYLYRITAAGIDARTAYRTMSSPAS